MTIFHPLVTNEGFLKESHELFCYLEEAALANICNNKTEEAALANICNNITEKKTNSKSKFMASLHLLD